MLAEDLNNLIAGQIQDPLFLVDMELSGDSKGRILRVVVDTDEGVTVAQISALSRGIGRALDEHDPIAGRYRLDVCSPGLDRPLTHPRVLAKTVGRKVKVRLLDPQSDPILPAELVGRLHAGGDDRVEIEVDGVILKLGWDRIQAIHHVLEW